MFTEPTLFPWTQFSSYLLREACPDPPLLRSGTYRGNQSSAVLITCLGSAGGPNTPQFCSRTRPRARPRHCGHSPLKMECVAAVDGGHISGMVEEVGADGAQRTDRHDD